MTRKILIADDHIVTRKGFEICCKQVETGAKVFHASNINDMYSQLKAEPHVDLLIMDIFMGDVTSLHHIQTIKRLYPNLAILIVSVGKDVVYGIRAIKEGANGYLNKMAEDAEIFEAIKKTLNNGYHFSNEILRFSTQMFNSDKAITNPFDQLSEREFNVLVYLLKGMETFEIANVMSLRPTTISTYKSRIFEKLNIERINDLKDMAKEYGIDPKS